MVVVVAVVHCEVGWIGGGRLLLLQRLCSCGVLRVSIHLSRLNFIEKIFSP